MPIIVDCVRGLLDSGQLHLMTEVENSRDRARLHGPLPGTSHPSLTSSHTPGRVRTVVRTFAARLDHIHGLDAVKLSTRSTDTLYAARPLYHALEGGCGFGACAWTGGTARCSWCRAGVRRSLAGGPTGSPPRTPRVSRLDPLPAQDARRLEKGLRRA